VGPVHAQHFYSPHATACLQSPLQMVTYMADMARLWLSVLILLTRRHLCHRVGVQKDESASHPHLLTSCSDFEGYLCSWLASTPSSSIVSLLNPGMFI